MSRAGALAARLAAAGGLLCAAFGLVLLVGAGARWHPLLAEPGAGIVFLVSGVALAGSAAFPLTLRRLAEREARGRDLKETKRRPEFP